MIEKATAPIRRRAPTPVDVNSTRLADGTPWTTFGGTISPSMLREATTLYLALGGGSTWAFDCADATGYAPDSIKAAIELFQRADVRAAGLQTILTAIPNPIVKMGARTVNLAMCLAKGPRIVVVDTALVMRVQIARERARGGNRR